MPKEIYIDLDATVLQWGSSTIGPSDVIILKPSAQAQARAQNTEAMYRTLVHSDSKWEELRATVSKLSIVLNYWTLFDILNVTGKMQTGYVSSNLTRSEKDTFLKLLQQFDAITVIYDDALSWDHDDDYYDMYDQIIETFANIELFDIRYRDKGAWALFNTMETAQQKYGTKPHQIVRIIGSDNNCYQGNFSEKYGYFLECESPSYTYDDGWSAFEDAEVKDIRTIIVLNAPMFINNTKPYFDPMKMFPSLRIFRSEGPLHLQEDPVMKDDGAASFSPAWNITLPSMPWLREISLTFESIHTSLPLSPGQHAELTIDVGNQENLIRVEICYPEPHAAHETRRTRHVPLLNITTVLLVNGEKYIKGPFEGRVVVWEATSVPKFL